MSIQHAKRLLGRVAAFGVAILLTFPCAAAGFAPKDAYFHTYETLADGLTYEEYYVDKEQTPQHGFVFTYTPGGQTLPVVTAGKSIWGRTTTTAMAKTLEDAGFTVSGGVNGDFFSFVTGIPLGIMMQDGEILCSDAGENALGITKDGTFIIGKPSISISMTRWARELPVSDPIPVPAPIEPPADTAKVPDTNIADQKNPQVEIMELTPKTVNVSHINKYPSIWGAYLCTPALGASTHSTEKSLELVFTIRSGRFAQGETVEAILSEVRTDSTNSDIPENGFVISIHNQYKNIADYTDLTVGDLVKITCSANHGWENVTFAIGGGDILIENGQVCRDIANEAHEKIANPRTAVGYTADGQLKVFAVDGKKSVSGSTGMNINSLAETMQNLGCIGALNLDGGGSTTVLVRAQDGAITLSNLPTEGNARQISNALFFLNIAAADGIPYFAEISPAVPIVYEASSIQLSPVFYDRSRGAAEMPQDAVVTWRCTGGSITEDGYFTPALPDADSTAPTVTMTVTKNDAETGQTTVLWEDTRSITVVHTLDSIQTESKTCIIPLGTTSEPLNFHGMYCGRRVAVDRSYVSAVFAESGNSICNDGEIHTDGSIQSTKTDGYTITKGFPAYTVRFTLKTADNLLFDTTAVTFGAAETLAWNMEDSKPGAVFSSDENAVYVYTANAGISGSAALSFNGTYLSPFTTPVSKLPVKSMRIWLKGEEEPSLRTEITVDGDIHTLPWKKIFDNSRLDGWCQYEADFTAIREAGIASFAVIALISADTPFHALLDNVTYFYGDTLSVFSDMEHSWAKEDVMTLYRMNIVNGSPNADGSYAYQPDGLLTRSAFAKFICLFARLEPVKLPDLTPYFIDANEIPAWAAPYIQAVAEAGLMRGKAAKNADGTQGFVFDANGTMTRAEVFQVLGALLPLDEEPLTTVFSDADSIPAWAENNIRVCVNAGIVSGFADGTIRPLAEITRAEIAALLCRTDAAMK